MAALKAWRLLRRLRCQTTRITSLVKASSPCIRPAQREGGKGITVRLRHPGTLHEPVRLAADASSRILPRPASLRS